MVNSDHHDMHQINIARLADVSHQLELTEEQVKAIKSQVKEILRQNDLTPMEGLILLHPLASIIVSERWVA